MSYALHDNNTVYDYKNDNGVNTYQPEIDSMLSSISNDEVYELANDSIISSFEDDSEDTYQSFGKSFIPEPANNGLINVWCAFISRCLGKHSKVGITKDLLNISKTIEMKEKLSFQTQIKECIMTLPKEINLDDSPINPYLGEIDPARDWF